MSIIENVGETVKLLSLTRAYNEYGDATTTLASSFISGIIVPMNADYNDVKAGILDTDDAIAIFASTESGIKNGNELYCALGSFSMQNTQKIIFGGTTHHLECELKKLTV